jgi:hypothetical protein
MFFSILFVFFQFYVLSYSSFIYKQHDPRKRDLVWWYVRIYQNMIKKNWLINTFWIIQVISIIIYIKNVQSLWGFRFEFFQVSSLLGMANQTICPMFPSITARILSYRTSLRFRAPCLCHFFLIFNINLKFFQAKYIFKTHQNTVLKTDWCFVR